MASTSEDSEGGPRFLRNRPTDLRTAARWHRYSHHIRTMPPALERLAASLDVPTGGAVLDYGCADVPYRHFVRSDANFVAADLPGNPKATLTLNPDSTVPSPDESFDAVLSTQVLEHVGDPGLYLSECFRVLKPGGRLLLSTHGIFVYHPDPVDLWRWTTAGLRRAVEAEGFEIVKFEGIIGLVATGLQLIQDAIYYTLPAPIRPVLALLLQTMISVADRLQSQSSRDMNASVFALVAQKP